MSKYNFDQVIDRRNTDSLKWDFKDDELPMWVADMDFEVSKEIQEALKNRIAHPVYGYTYQSDSWYQAYINFFKERHELTLQKDWILFCTGVVPTISSSVRKLTKPHEHVVVTTPVYNIFFNSIVNNDRIPLEVPLLVKKDENTNEDKYYFDFEKLEEAFKQDDVSLFILCNPQNPVGRIWTKEELDKVGKLAYKYNVTVLSDEIHCEITRPGFDYVPFIKANDINKDICVMAISVTKSFNLAGIQTSAIVIPNEDLRKKVNRQINTDEVAEPNIFACVAAIAALNDSRDWLDEMRRVVFRNREIVEKYIQNEIDDLKVIKGDATYLVWIDTSKICKKSTDFVKFLKEQTGLIVSDGSVYGKTGESYFRLNVACPLDTLNDGLKRLKKGVELFKKSK